MRSMRWCWLVAVTTLAVAASARAHPKPGAHADVRITIRPDAVAVECLMNLRFIEQLINWPRAERDEIATDEEGAMAAAIAEYFGAAAGPASAVVDRPNRVRIDGVTVAPVIRECRVIRPAPETRPGFVDVTGALLPQVLAIAEYTAKSPPRSVAIAWGTYPRDFLAQDRDLAPIVDVEAVLLAAGEVTPVVFKADEPEFVWHAPSASLESRFRVVPTVAGPARATLPALSIAAMVLALMVAFRLWRVSGTPRAAGATLAGAIAAAVLWPYARVPAPFQPVAPLPTPGQALAVFEPLHANIYRAFDYTSEVEIYDALARSVDGPLLARVYDDIYRSLIMHEEGGALSRVRSVRPVHADVSAVRRTDSGVPAFDVTTRWLVEGVVYHWGHSHVRLNEYLARYTVEARGDSWRITAVVPLEQRRVDRQRAPA